MGKDDQYEITLKQNKVQTVLDDLDLRIHHTNVISIAPVQEVLYNMCGCKVDCILIAIYMTPCYDITISIPTSALLSKH